MLESDIVQVLSDPRLKVKRAKRHIDTLIHEASVMPKYLYVIRNSPAYTNAALANPDCFDLTFIPKEPIPEHYQSIIGDAINNLRESLDFLVTRIVRKAGGTQKVHFPFANQRQELPNSPYWNKIERVAPNTTAFIEKTIAPCEDADSDIWRLNKLCVLNKHNDFAPSLAIAIATFDYIKTGRSTSIDFSAGFNANHKGNIIRSSSPITIKGNVKVSCEITFAEGSYFDSKPVIPTLFNIENAVSKTLNSFEVFLRETSHL